MQAGTQAQASAPHSELEVVRYYKMRGCVRDGEPELVHLGVRWVMAFGDQTRQAGDTLCTRSVDGERVVRRARLGGSAVD